MKRACVAALMSICLSTIAWASTQDSVDECIEAWGSKSPFKKGTAPDKVISSGVKVFGVGKNKVGDEEVTGKPALVLVRPAVNVLGKSTIRLANPNGWYCLKSNVTVLGKIVIEAHCNSKLVNATENGATVLAANDADNGVAVLGSLRVSRFQCEDSKTELKKEMPQKDDEVPQEDLNEDKV